MKDFVAFLMTLLFGAILGFLASQAASQAGLQECAHKNNIYQCEWAAVPKKAG